ncbi:MAG: hypothetical protein OXT65_00275 [Alphaproteobacteria bacterium]|nr:hypothetical protein [Alphaproteobacteria bacterium]
MKENKTPSGDCAAECENTAGQKKRSWLSSVFQSCASCTGAGAAGFVAGHAGCVITPLVLAASAGTAATGGLSALAIAFGAAATAGGVFAWKKLRGPKASKAEKRIVYGSALTGLAVSAAMQLGAINQPAAAIPADCPLHTNHQPAP